jgi:sugar lactone lactonase YvrE
MSIPDIECVLRAGALNGERPAWDAQRQRLFWVDLREPALHAFDPATGRDRHWEMPAWIGSYALTARGAFVALRTGLYALDFEHGHLEFRAPPPFDPRRFLFNEGDCDRQGRFWAGPMYLALAPEDQVPTAPRSLPFWRYDRGAWRPGTVPVQTANSLAWSADGTRMYHSDTAQKTIWVSDYDIEAGMPSNMRLFAHVDAPDDGGPDGVAIDRDGFLWCAVFGGGRLDRLDPDGRVERSVAMPVQYPTMPALGGTDLSTLFVTSACWPVAPEERKGRPLEGGLFAFAAPCPGLPATRLADQDGDAGDASGGA